MDYIQSSNKQADKFGPGAHGFSAGNPTGGVPATFFTPDWTDGVQQEHINVIKASGLVPSGASFAQVVQAIKRMFGGNVTTVNAANSPYVLTADNAGLVIMDATAGNIVANLPAVNVIAQPLRFSFVRADATTNTATGNRAGADTFLDGGTSFTLSGRGDFKNIVGDSVSKWLPASSPIAAGANKATNPEFSVNQDAVVSPYTAASGVYGHDGWKAGAGGVTYSFAAVSGLTTVTITAGTLLHPVDPVDVDSSTVTISWTGTAQARVGAGAYAASPLTVTGLALDTQFNVEFGLGTVTKLKIENGTLATPYIKRSPEQEMAKACWYYNRSTPSGVGHDFAVPTNLTASLSNTFRITVPYTTQMRQTPSITILTQSLSDRASSNLVVNSGTNRFAMTLQADVAAGSGVAQWVNVRWKLDARL